MENSTMYIYMLPFLMERENASAGDFSLIRLQFAHYGNGSLSFVRLLAKKQTKANPWQTD